MIWVDDARLLGGLGGTVGASCVTMLRSWDPLGYLEGPIAVPKGTFVLISLGNTVFFISAIDVPAGDR